MLKVYKLNDKATLPKFATEQSACFDIASSESYIIAPGGTVAISTGLIFDIPLGYSIRLHPRSGLALKHGITMKNAEGVIDSDYTNELKVLVWNTQICTSFEINPGDRIAQGELVKNLDYTIEECYTTPVQKTNRVGGFGSTGIGS